MSGSKPEEITPIDVSGKAENLAARVSALKWAWYAAVEQSDGFRERRQEMDGLSTVILETIERDANELAELTLAYNRSLRAAADASDGWGRKEMCRVKSAAVSIDGVTYTSTELQRAGLEGAYLVVRMPYWPGPAAGVFDPDGRFICLVYKTVPETEED